MSKVKPLKTAVIGCGMISDIYLKNLKDTFSVIDLVGCSDMVLEKAERQAEKYGIRSMTNEEIFSDKEIELVINLTYPSSHFEVSKAALISGKHVYSEKMLADTLPEADELMKIAKEKNLRFSVSPDTFLGSSMQTCRNIIDTGLIGEPIMANVRLVRGYHMIKEDKDDACRKFSVMAKGGGIPYDMAGYYLHALFNIFGAVSQVCGFGYTRNANRPYLNPRHSKFRENYFVDTENSLAAVLKFDCGLLCTMSVTSEGFGQDFSFEICGTEGTLYLPDPNNFSGSIYIKRNGSDEKYLFPKTHPYSENSRGIGAAEMAWSIRENRPHRLSAEFGYHALEVIKAVCECSNDGQVKKLKSTLERPRAISSLFYGGNADEYNLSI